eukprot:scaffold5519_cov166-Amphora_coffeaeformis.AAC.2
MPRFGLSNFDNDDDDYDSDDDDTRQQTQTKEDRSTKPAAAASWGGGGGGGGGGSGNRLFASPPPPSNAPFASPSFFSTAGSVESFKTTASARSTKSQTFFTPPQYPTTPQQQQQQKQQQQQATNYQTPIRTTTTTASNTNDSSVRLACTSPNGKIMFAVTTTTTKTTASTMAGREFVLHAQPLEQQKQQQQQQSDSVDSVTKLTLPISAVLQLDPPKELLCLDTEDNDTSTTTDGSSSTATRLLLYCAQHVWMIQISQHQQPSKNTTAATTPVVECTPLLESFFLSNDNTNCNILRVRNAPQRADGYACYAPATSVAVLIQSSSSFSYNDNTEYHLVTLHAATGKYRTALVFTEDEQDPVVDFAFAKSNGPLALTSSLTIFVLKASFDVSCASPIVFDDSIVPKSTYQDALQCFTAMLDETHLPRGTPRRRQALAAQRYLIEVFGSSLDDENEQQQDDPSHRSRRGRQFYQANLAATEASSWPVVYQTNVWHGWQQNKATSTNASCLECVTAGDFSGILVGGQAVPPSSSSSSSSSGGVTMTIAWGMANPVALLPLFSLAGFDDRMAIQDIAAQHTHWVERVQLVLGSSSSTSSSFSNPTATSNTPSVMMDLVVDKNSEQLVHVVVPTAVHTVSTNTFYVAAKQLQASQDTFLYGEVPPKRTTAWQTLTTTGAQPIRGTAVWSSPTQGRDGMSVVLADATMTHINVAQQQYRHQLDMVFPPTSQEQLAVVATQPSAALQTLQSIPPFYEVIEPVVKEINQGLDNMGKIVGSHTLYLDITPDLMAVAIDVKERCEKQVAKPVLTLKNLCSKRRKALLEMIDSHNNRLNDLLAEKTDLQTRQDGTMARISKAVENMQILAERSAFILEQIKGTAPTMTKAEEEYCHQMEQMRVKVDFWQQKARALMNKAQQQTQILQDTTTTTANNTPTKTSTTTTTSSGLLSPEHKQSVSKLGDVGDYLIEKSKKRLHELDEKLQAIRLESGMDAPAGVKK